MGTHEFNKGSHEVLFVTRACPSLIKECVHAQSGFECEKENIGWDGELKNVHEHLRNYGMRNHTSTGAPTECCLLTCSCTAFRIDEMLLRSGPFRYACTPTEYYVMTRCAPVECYALTRSWPVHVRFHCGRKAWLALWCSFGALLRRLGRLRHVAPYCAVNPKNVLTNLAKKYAFRNLLGKMAQNDGRWNATFKLPVASRSKFGTKGEIGSDCR